MIRKTRRGFPKILSLILAMALILTMLPGGVLTAKADANGLNLQTSNGGTYQTTVNGTDTIITLLTAGNYTISGSATNTEIVVQYSVAANITLNSVTIYGINSGNAMYPGTPALYITSSLLNPDIPYQARTSQANLTLVGTNKLVGGNARPGIGMPKDGTYLSINGSGSLEADGTDGGAGIGGAAVLNSNEDNDCGEVLIYGATVIANGSTGSGGIGGGAGIGGSCFGDGGKVTIKGNSTVTATGGAFAAGIGGGACIRVDEGGTTGIVRHGGDGGSLLVWGSWVKATGGAGGAGIGGGSSTDDQCAGDGSTVTIYSGTVQALAGGPNNSIYGYGMGAGAASDSGNYGLAGSYTIFGGSVYAKGVTSDKSLDAVPTNGSGPVYMTTLHIPNITAPTTVTSCSTYTLGGSITDSSGFLYPYLPAGSKSMDIAINVMSGILEHRFSGSVDTSGSSWLKIQPMDQFIFVNNTRWDGTSNMSTTFIYNGTPISTTAESASTTFHYTGMDNVTNTAYNSSVGPTDCGTYQVQITSEGDDSFYPILSSYNLKIGITITPKSISGCNMTFGNPQSTYEYSDGNHVDPSYTVSDGGVTLPSYDYTTVYKNDTDIVALMDTNPPTVTLTGKGNYTGLLAASYTIEKAPNVTVSADPTDWTTGSVTLKADVTVGSSGTGSVTVTKASDPSHPQTLTGGNPLPSGAMEYTYSAVQNDTYTFTVTDGAGYTASSGITVGNIDSVNPVLGTVSGNPTTPAQAADLNFPVSAVSGIKDITVSRETGSNTWEPVTGVTVTKIINQDCSYTCSYHTTANGTYKFTVKNGSGLTTDTAPVNVTQIDLVQPVLSVSGVSDSKSYTSGNWANHTVQLNLSNTAANIGTTTYQYRIVGKSTWKTAVSGIVDIAEEGTTQLELQATSASGKVSNIVNYTVKIDTIAPSNVDVHFSPDPFKSIAHFATFGLFFGDTVSVTLTATDGNSSIDHYEYQKVNVGGIFDEKGSWQTTAPSISPDFGGTIYARAVDKAGNASGYVAKSLVVDKTAPSITANGGNPSLKTIDKSVSIPVTITDNGAGIGIITYQINGGSAQTVDFTLENYNDVTKTYSFDIGSLPDGIYGVTINAQDNSGNSAQTVTVNVNKDTLPKVNSVTVTPGSAFLNHGSTQQFHASVTGTNNPSAVVIWSVAGNKSSGTNIDTTGKLTVASDESAKILTVTAASAADHTKFGQTAITVNTSGQSGFGFSNSTLTKAYGNAPFTILATGGQGSGSVTYAVTNGDDVVSVNGHTITIKKVGTAVITATKAADGSFYQATEMLTINVEKATPIIKIIPKATQFITSNPLSSSIFSGGMASVPGNFTWTKPATVVNSSGSYEVTFTPTDTTDYETVAFMVPVVISLQVTDSNTNVTVDLSDCSLPNGVTSVMLSSSAQTPASGGSAYTVVIKRIGENQTLGNLEKLTVYDLSLLDQNGKPLKNFTGKIKVKIPIPEGVSGDLHIFWYDTDKGMLTDMHAIRENNYLVFETSHFSYYAIASFRSAAPNENPKTGGDGSNSMWWLLAALPMVGGAAYGIRRKRFLLKKKIY